MDKVPNCGYVEPLFLSFCLGILVVVKLQPRAANILSEGRRNNTIMPGVQQGLVYTACARDVLA